MFRLTLCKMWNKKWMNLCLLIGIVLMVGTLVSFPLYQGAAYDRMLQDEFEVYLQEEGAWPTVNTLVTHSQKDKKGSTIKKMEKIVKTLDEELGVTGLNTIYYYSLTASDLLSEMDRPDIVGNRVRLAFVSDFTEHVNMLYGENLSEKGLTEDGAIEVLVDESCLVEKGFLLGETLTLENVSGPDGKPVRIYIKGVFDTSNNDDFYWQIDKLDLLNVCFMQEDLFREYFLGDRVGKYNLSCEYFHLFDYKKVSFSQVDELASKIKYYTEKSKYRSVFSEPPYRSILESYQKKLTRISGTLSILQIPVLVMLAAFLIMISGQMYEMEKNEISVIKSRGSYRSQIFGLYLMQNLLLVLVGGVLGILLGRVFASILGATRNFLEFSGKDALKVSFSKEGMLYAAVGMLFALLCLTIPAIKHSRISIVNLKQSRSSNKKPLWEKLFLDIILLGVALYGYYSFQKDLTAISDTVLSGESLDPLLYISSSLFILGAGLFYLRVQPYLVQLIYLIGKRHWGPAGYISFMENRRNGRKQQIIMLFLIMTISLGMYHAIVARTILDNALENQEYLDGVDLVMKEKWEAVKDANGMATGEYQEPDFQKYMTADFMEKCTRVYYDDEAYYSVGKNDHQMITVYGIHTKEFGEMTSLSEGLNEKSYYTYLNELAPQPKGVLVSSNFKTSYDFEVGDTIYFRNASGTEAYGIIVDFVDYWPGFAKTRTVINADGEAHTEDNFLIVTHYAMLSEVWPNRPYEIWMNVSEDADQGAVYDFIDDHNMHLRKFVNSSKNEQSVLGDPLLQGTNGVLTLGFAVTILLCGIGYLIFWIMSVRSRELVFGVLRAGGLHAGELIAVLLSEQLFCGLFSCIAGAGIGTITSLLFIPILQYAYASADQTLPMRMIVNTADMFRLYGVILLVMAVAIGALISILKHMNITKALKLGEE